MFVYTLDDVLFLIGLGILVAMFVGACLWWLVACIIDSIRENKKNKRR